MRRIFALILVALLAGVGLVALIQSDPGYVLLAYGNYTLETSLWMGLLLLLVLIFLVWLVVQVLRRLFVGPDSLLGWFGSRRARASARLTNEGLISFAGGDWSRARRQLLRGAAGSETPLVNYLAAATASHRLGETQKSSEYLDRAGEADPEAEIAVALTRAELQLEAGQYNQALGTLEPLRGDAGRHPRILDLLQQGYRELGYWQRLVDLLPGLGKHQVLPEDDLRRLEREAYGRLLQQGGQRRDGTGAEGLRGVWQKMPSGLKQDPEMIRVYAGSLIGQAAHAEAEKVILRALGKQWDPQLVRLFGYLESDDPARLLAQAESWLEAHPEDPQLLLCLGRHAARNSLWGKARDYFERSYRLEPTAETGAELGRLLSALGEPRIASVYYRDGLFLKELGLPELPLPEEVAASD
jgi:HemY protein